MEGPRRWVRFNRHDHTAASSTDAVTRIGTVRDITLEEPTIEEGSWGASTAPGRPDRNWHDLPARQDPRAMRPIAGEKTCAACQGAIASWM